MQAMENSITSMVLTKDSSALYIIDRDGFVRRMEWIKDNDSNDQFEFHEYPIKISDDYCRYYLCLTKDDKKLFISNASQIYIYD